MISILDFSSAPTERSPELGRAVVRDDTGSGKMEDLIVTSKQSFAEYSGIAPVDGGLNHHRTDHNRFADDRQFRNLPAAVFLLCRARQREQAHEETAKTAVVGRGIEALISRRAHTTVGHAGRTRLLMISDLAAQ